MLMKKLMGNDFETKQAKEDADFLIVNTAIEMSMSGTLPKTH